MITKSVMSRDDVIAMIDTYSPYSKDRGELKALAAGNSEALKKLSGDVDDLKIEAAKTNALLRIWLAGDDEKKKAARR